MKINEIVSILDKMFPLELQEKYDNTGSQVIFSDIDLSSIMLALDIDDSIIDEAIEKKCNLIITHHPFFFKPIKRMISHDPKTGILLKLIENKISLYSIHTNLDKIYYDKLGEILGLENRRLLIQTDYYNYNEKGLKDESPVGFGIISELAKPIKLDKFLKGVKNSLNLDFIIYSGNAEDKISNVAVVNGSGGSSIEMIIMDNDIDCIITGDVGYHHSKIALDNSVSVIDAGHFGTEKILLDFLLSEVQDCLTNKYHLNDIMLYISENEENPFKLFT